MKHVYPQGKRLLSLFNSRFVITTLSLCFLNFGASAQLSLGQLTEYLFVFTNGSMDANWQSASKGFIGDVAINGDLAKERTSGSFGFKGKIYTNSANLGAFQQIINNNQGQAQGKYNQGSKINSLINDLNNALNQIKSLPVTAGFGGINSADLDGINTTNGVGQTIVINVTSGFSVNKTLDITGDANDLFIIRWDEDQVFSNGYNGKVKFYSGGGIVPHGGLSPTNFINVAGDIGSSGGGNNPASPYPQGPRNNNGNGSLINSGSDFHGGGFFTGYWLTTGDPVTGQTSSLSNAIFVGGWYSTTTKFSMTSGTSGIHLTPPSDIPAFYLFARAAYEEEPDIISSVQLNIFPNPVREQLNISIPGEWQNKKMTIQLVGINGAQIKTIDIANAGAVQPINTSTLQQGIYFVKAICDGKIVTQKILKQ
jgi:hypothetical protein